MSRRRLLQGATGAGTALAGMGLLACSSAGRKPAPAAHPQTGAAPAAAGPPRAGGTYHGYITTNATLDPLMLSQVPTDQLAGGVMSRLFRFKTSADPKTITNHDVENDLAVSGESPDAVTWTFKLRPDAKFQDIPPVNGHAVEAEDIKSSFTRALSLPQNPNRGAIAMVNPDQIETPDARTVVFKLNSPYYYSSPCRLKRRRMWQSWATF